MTTLPQPHDWRQMLAWLHAHPLGTDEYDDMVQDCRQKIAESEAEIQPLNVQLKAAREAVDLTIIEVANRLNISREHLGRLEKGYHNFTPEMTMFLMDIYGLKSLTFKDDSGYFVSYVKGGTV